MKLFRDDYGFEGLEPGEATDAPPGSPEKVSMLAERVSRGQSLWHADDPLELSTSIKCEPCLKYKTVGNQDCGAVIGDDQHGRPHRYALWKKTPKNREPFKIVYVTELTSYDDTWRRDLELAAIYSHADRMGASHVCVCSLFTKRCKSFKDFVESEGDPVTQCSSYLLRLHARKADMVVMACGEHDLNCKATDTMWALSRDKSGVIYSIEEHCDFPPEVTRDTPPIVYPFQIKAPQTVFEELTDDLIHAEVTPLIAG